MKKFNIPTRTISEAVGMAAKKKIVRIPKTRLRSLYLNKRLSIPQIARELNHDSSIIVRELEGHNIPRRSHGETLSLSLGKNRIKRGVIQKLYYKHHLTQKEIAKRVNRSMGHICSLMKEYKLKTRTADKYHTRYKKYIFSNNLEEKAYFLGLRLGDLSARLVPSKKLIRVDTTSTKIEQIQLFRDIFKNYGHVWVSKPRKDGNRLCAVLLDRTFGFLLPKKDNIPIWARKNKRYFLSFLAGYTDAEGCIGIGSNNTAFFRLSSYDKNILKQIYQQLLGIGIKCNPPRVHVKRGHKKSDGYVYNNDEWSFYINKKATLLSLLHLLKSRLKHRKRLKDLKAAEQNIIKRNQKTLPEKAPFKY